ncbi:MAG: T9SS type A sorting domain-containing protein [Bacteroidales bacterium]|nr:T9SS type A sorting domain-containing protein [Bacteroidales bacterium]
MRKIVILAIVLQLGLVNLSTAQVTVNNNGKLTVGRNMHTSQSIEDFHNVLTATIFGKNGIYNAGAKLSFGDFGRYEYYSWNVFVGEYDDVDTDQLWLHGKNGMYFTYGRSGFNELGTICYFDVNRGWAFTFLRDVRAKQFWTITPAQYKSVAPLQKSLKKLLSLDGIHYTYSISDNQSLAESSDSSSTQMQASPSNLSPKEQQDMAFFSQLKSEMLNKEELKIGLSLEQLSKEFPELVDTNADGEISVDYIGLIPVIIEALKEQSEVIRAQSLKIKEIDDNATLGSNAPSSSQKSTKNASTTADTTQIYNAFLYQNTPNPFNSQTEIRYFLPEEVTSANIYIFSMQGNLLSTYTLNPAFGFGSIFISATELNPGIYFYSLTVNNQEVDTKKMILTQ